MLLWTWWMLSLVVTAAYTGTLTSFLSVSTQPLLFSTARDLLTKSHLHKWGVFDNTVIAMLLEVVLSNASAVCGVDVKHMTLRCE